jgi:hypothetical protein
MNFVDFYKVLGQILSTQEADAELIPCVFLMQQEEMPSGLKDPLIQTLIQNVRVNSMSKGPGIKNL